MNHLTREYVTKLKDSLLFINAVVIIYNASLFLLSTKYISVHYYARDFLNKVSYITRTPEMITVAGPVFPLSANRCVGLYD